MLALIAMLTIASPPPATFDCDEGGQVVCWFTRRGRRCTCESDVLNLGEWDPRPSPGEWPTTSYYNTEPPAWGTYPTEKRDP